MGSDETDVSFEKAVIAQAPPGSVVVGASLSPDGRYGAALTLLPTATDYLMDDLLVRVDGEWELLAGGSGGGIQWTGLDGENGVLRFGDEAPPEASTAWIRYEGRDYPVSVRHGHFLFVAWQTRFHEYPSVVRFD